MKQQNVIPKPALWLGYAGLIPFFITAILSYTTDYAYFSTALIAYGATILSFLGGVRWGLAIVNSNSTHLSFSLVISILPSIVGWISLLLPSYVGFMLLAGGFFVLLLADIRSQDSPPWYPRLRVPLSLGAMTCLIFSFLMQLL